MISSAIIKELLDHFTAGPSTSKKVFIGLDGYVDRIQKAVRSTSTDLVNEYFTSLEEFGAQISNAAGKSTQIELVSSHVKAGGNAPIMAQALASLGLENTCLGTFGVPMIDPVFQVMHTNCTLLSVGDPASTNALEFEDGKLILSEIAVFEKINWAYVKEKVGLEELTQICAESALIALVDWSNLPYASDIWKGVLEEILIPNPQIKPYVFFDLCDPYKKSDQEMMDLVQVLQAFGQQVQVILGLNDNEAIQLYNCLRRNNGAAQILDHLKDQGLFIYQHLNIASLLIHPIDSCYLFQDVHQFHLTGHVVEQPKITTGGGDNFNAGFCYGLLNNLSPEACMLAAMATSGAYVMYGESPSSATLIKYIKTFISAYE